MTRNRTARSKTKRSGMTMIRMKRRGRMTKRR